MQTIALLAALIAGAVAEIWSPPPYRRWPLLTLAVALLTVAGFALQSAWPDLTPMLTRDPGRLASGEVWRAFTALFLPEGGVRELLVNLFWLLVLGTAAERRFSRPVWLAIYFGGGVAAEGLALVWGPGSAGNLIACLVLAGALCSDWREGPGRWWRAGVGLSGAVAAFLLLTENDGRAIGFFVGLAIGFVAAALAAARARRAAPAKVKAKVAIYRPGTDTRH